LSKMIDLPAQSGGKPLLMIPLKSVPSGQDPGTLASGHAKTVANMYYADIDTR
jgi:hypothetical protein